MQKPGNSLHRSIRDGWMQIFASLVLLALVLSLLAFEVVPGVPDPKPKPVTTFYPSNSAKMPLSLFVEPPMDLLVTDSPETLAIQLTNTSQQTIDLIGIDTDPSSCFRIDRLPESPATDVSRVMFFQLTAAQDKPPKDRAGALEPKCHGAHSLTLRYSFSESVSGSLSSPQRKVRMEGSVTTSPIRIVSRRRLEFEQFLHLAALFAVPIILGIATYLIQRFQTVRADAQKSYELERAESQKRHELELEVWKIVYPVIDRYIRRYYVPIARQMNVVRAEIRESAAPGGIEDVVASLLVLRSLVQKMNEKVGGYSFRSRQGEELCGDLANYFWDKCYLLAGSRDDFIKAVDVVLPADTTVKARAKLSAQADADASVPHRNPTLKNFLAASAAAFSDPVALKHIDKFLRLMLVILDFENNYLWFPEWYTVPPVIDLNFDFSGLGLSEREQKGLQIVLGSYHSEIKNKHPECLAI